MEVAITDKNNQDTNLRAAEVEPTSTLRSAKHNAAQSDAPRLEQGKLRKFRVHDGQGGRQRAPSPASSERVLFNESFYAKSFDDLPGDNEHPLIGFKRTGEAPPRRASSTETEATTIRSSIDSATAQEAAEKASQLLPLSPNSREKLRVIPSDAAGCKETKGVVDPQARGFEAMPERPRKRRKTARCSKAQPQYK